MISFYHKVFYHLYKLAIKSGEKTAPLTSVVPTLAFLQISNSFCLFMILDMLGIRVLTDFLENKNMTTNLIIITVVLIGLNYSYFLNGRRGEKLVEVYSQKPIKERKRGALITLIYALVSIALIFILAPLRVKLM